MNDTSTLEGGSPCYWMKWLIFCGIGPCRDVLRSLVYRFVAVTVAPVGRDRACWKLFAQKIHEVAARSTASSELEGGSS